MSNQQVRETLAAEVYQSEELVPFYSHSPLRPERPSDDYGGGGKYRKKPRRPLGAESETFKSSNNNNNIMAAESKFDKLSDKIAKQYRKKGMSAKKAKEIGNKTAYTIGKRKYGKAGMAKKARAGMKAEGYENLPHAYPELREYVFTNEESMEFDELIEARMRAAKEEGLEDWENDSNAHLLSGHIQDLIWEHDDFDAESFGAEGNPDKRTTTQYAKFYVGFEDDEGELRGGGKFKKYDDALAQADIVSEREGNSRIVTTRGFALWTDDGKGMWQEGYDKTVAKEFYSAEGYSIGSGFRLGFGLGLGMLALSTVTTMFTLAVSKIDERQVD